MTRLSRARTALCALTLGLAMLAPVVPTTSASADSTAPLARARATLHVPDAFVGGQRILFRGNIGRRGKRRVHVQAHMDRPGDVWRDLAGSGARTRRNGSFRFRFRAPSMRGIKVRVVSGRLATPAVMFNARSQDLTLDAPQRVAPRRPFTIAVDTTPDHLYARPDLDGTPVFEGRRLTLQQRLPDGAWKYLATTTVDGQGNGTFTTEVGSAGEAVYRVVQGRRRGVGWFPSFPVPVTVGGPSSSAAARSSSSAGPASTHRRVTGTIPARAGAATTAGSRFKWGRPLWVFDWEFGEDLTTRPKGSRKGRWVDHSTGYGRVAKHNGGMMITSERDVPTRNQAVRGEGTTTATLRQKPMRYGRWETKMRLKRMKDSGRDYHAVIELVPDRQPDSRCGVITVADVAVNGANRSTLDLGVTARRGTSRWTRRLSYTLEQTRNHAFAVEVGKRHVTWFLNGQVIGAVRGRGAVPPVPMTLRLRLVGDGQQEMNKTQFISDWQRAYSLDRGRQRRGRTTLQRGTQTGC